MALSPQFEHYDHPPVGAEETNPFRQAQGGTTSYFRPDTGVVAGRHRADGSWMSFEAPGAGTPDDPGAISQGLLWSRSELDNRDRDVRRRIADRLEVRDLADSDTTPDKVRSALSETDIPRQDLENLSTRISHIEIDNLAGSTLGQFHRGPSPSDQRIVVRPNEDTLRPTLVHEIGHALHIPHGSQVSSSPAGRYPLSNPDPVHEGVADGYMQRYSGRQLSWSESDMLERPYAAFTTKPGIANQGRGWGPFQQVEYTRARQATVAEGVPSYLNAAQMAEQFDVDPSHPQVEDFKASIIRKGGHTEESWADAEEYGAALDRAVARRSLHQERSKVHGWWDEPDGAGGTRQRYWDAQELPFVDAHSVG